MDRNSRIELQKIDCNCNDCAFLFRDFDAYNKSKELHKKWQLEDFEIRKEKLLKLINEKKNQDEIDLQVIKDLERQYKKMRFQFDKSTCSTSFGKCAKLQKSVAFIPSTCMIETQDCFKHRSDVL